MKLGGNPELFWLSRLKQSGLFGPETPYGELLEPSPIHDPHLCEECRFGPCDWLTAQLEREFRKPRHSETPTT